jgi:hypothetical protein
VLTSSSIVSVSRQLCQTQYILNTMPNNFASMWKQQWSPKRRHYMGRSEVSTIVVKWSGGLSNRMSVLSSLEDIQIKRISLLMWLFCLSHFFSYSFVSILYHCIYGCMFCVFVFNLANYVFLLLCLCILIVMFMYSYCYIYVFLLLCLCILIVMFMYSYCYVYVFLLLCMFCSGYSVSLCCPCIVCV